jgi:hypothetical protein
MGLVTEGASSNAWIVDAEGAPADPGHPSQHPARRHPLDPAGGDPRDRPAGVSEKPFTIAEAQGRQGGLHHRRRHAGHCRSSDRRRENGRWQARSGGDAPAASYIERAPKSRLRSEQYRQDVLWRGFAEIFAELVAFSEKSSSMALFVWGACCPLDNNRGEPPMSAEKKQNLQDTFLNSVRKSKTPLTIFLSTA